MARDGTNRGGRRVRAGDKPVGAAEKIQNGKAVFQCLKLQNFQPWICRKERS